MCEKEPFRKLVNQGMIQGRSNFVYRIKGTNTFVSCGLKDQYDTTEIHVDVNIVHNDRLDTEAFRKWMPDYATAEFILEDGEYICGWAIEKMSKSMFNVVNPDNVCDTYGADTLRLYEMFLGPVEQSKPWDTKGIDGVHRFLRKFWRLYYGKDGALFTDTKASAAGLKVLHKLIHKVSTDIENFSMNTSVSAFMIAVNELTELGCTSREILEPMVILLSPFAPHICEELWNRLGHDTSAIPRCHVRRSPSTWRAIPWRTPSSILSRSTARCVSNSSCPSPWIPRTPRRPYSPLPIRRSISAESRSRKS